MIDYYFYRHIKSNDNKTLILHDFSLSLPCAVFYAQTDFKMKSIFAAKVFL